MNALGLSIIGSMKNYRSISKGGSRRLTLALCSVFLLVGHSAVALAQTTTVPEQPPQSVIGKPEAEETAALMKRSKQASLQLQPDPLESLRSARLIFVVSHSLLVGPSVIETKLRNRREFQQLGLMITRDVRAADLILEVKHDILTKYVFTAVDPRTNVVVASGKLSSLGGTVAGKVADRFMKQLIRARLGA